MYNTIVSLGYGNKPIWITESGFASDNIGDEAQGVYLTEMLAGMASRPWWKKFFWYQIWEGPTDRSGLLYQNEAPKPAWYFYRDYTAAHPAPETVSINLSSTDITDGLNRVTVGDGHTTPDTKAGRACRRNTNAIGGDYYMYFNVDDEFAFQGDRPVVAISVDYYDLGTGTLTLQYDSIGGGAYKSAGSVTLGNKDAWMQYTFYLNDAYLGNRQNNGADFRIFGGVGVTFYLDLVQVSTLPTGDFNGDGTVNAADYVVWRKGFGTSYTQNDYNTWRAHFGQATGSGAGTTVNAAVPEPRTLVMCVGALIGFSIPVGRRAAPQH
jgi:hypothetical protein